MQVLYPSPEAYGHALAGVSQAVGVATIALMVGKRVRFCLNYGGNQHIGAEAYGHALAAVS